MGQRGTDNLLVIPLALVELQAGKPGALADRGLPVRRQIAVLLSHPVKRAELDRRGPLWSLAAGRKRHGAPVCLDRLCGLRGGNILVRLSLNRGANQGDGGKGQDDGEDSGSFHAAPRLPLRGAATASGGLLVQSCVPIKRAA